MKKKFGALSLKLTFTENDIEWTSVEELVWFGEEGRFWAQKIFEVILYFAKKHNATLNCFLALRQNQLGPSARFFVVDTCENCLEQLKNEVFFGVKTDDSPGNLTL